MAGFQVRERIARRPGEVWDTLVDFKRAPAWMPGVDELSLVEGEPAAVGSKLRERARGAYRDTLVTAWEAPRILGLTTRQGGFEATYTYALAEIGDETEVELRAECRARGAWKLIGPIIGVLMKRADSRQLSLLKLLVEARD